MDLSTLDVLQQTGFHIPVTHSREIFFLVQALHGRVLLVVVVDETTISNSQDNGNFTTQAFPLQSKVLVAC